MSPVCCPLEGSDGCDEPSVFAVSIVKAAKEHQCAECREPIPKGAKHELVKGLWDGHWSTHRTCSSCKEIRQHFACNGWIYGQLWEDLENNFFPDMKAGGQCMTGLSPEAKYRLFDERTKWLLERDEEPDGIALPPKWQHLRPPKPAWLSRRVVSRIAEYMDEEPFYPSSES